MTAAYAPRRDLVSKVRRRMTQHYAARRQSLLRNRSSQSPSMTFPPAPRMLARVCWAPWRAWNLLRPGGALRPMRHVRAEDIAAWPLRA